MPPGEQIRPCAEWDIRTYKLIGAFDPKGLGEGEFDLAGSVA